jgi:SAM-dependent methyltransferase
MSGRDINWVYQDSDPALMLWTASYQRWGLQWPCERPRILELGCQESDFAERMIRLNPSVSFTGVDVRNGRDATGWTFVQGDARDREMFQAAAFDVIVLLGALEHFGLGFYGDPVDDVPGMVPGDTQTMQNVASWLTPGGWVYFDVPCNPTFSIADNRHFRTYAPADVQDRLIVPGLTERVRGYSDCEPHAGAWLEGPPETHKVPYHFVAVVADRPADAGHRHRVTAG